MYYIENSNVFRKTSLESGGNAIIFIGTEFITEEAKDEAGNVIGTVTKQFNLTTGQYEAV